jgi:NhaP-type Na+/H+ or K+/H+ antiporter
MSWRGFKANLRPILLLAVGTVILLTLVGQGLSLPLVIEGLGLTAECKREADDEARRRIERELDL